VSYSPKLCCGVVDGNFHFCGGYCTLVIELVEMVEVSEIFIFENYD
jgi:hypothetical protein